MHSNCLMYWTKNLVWVVLKFSQDIFDNVSLFEIKIKSLLVFYFLRSDKEIVGGES